MLAARLVAAAAGLAVALAGASLHAVTATAAAKPGYVGIVISGHRSACVRWQSGITGDEVLNAVAQVVYRPTDGLIVQIDGTPKSAQADANHYWSYWHDTGSGWSYSSLGASGYHPAAGTVEGWNYINGTSNQPPSASGAYAGLCGALDQPSPTPRPTSSPPPSRTTSPARPGSTAHSTAPRPSSAHRIDPRSRPPQPATTARDRSTGAAPNPRRHTSSTASQHRAVAAARHPSTHAPSSGRPTHPVPNPSAAAPVAAVASTRPTDHSSSGSALPTVITAAIVLMLAAGAAVGWRRHRMPR
jgi:hypothetical protein